MTHGRPRLAIWAWPFSLLGSAALGLLIYLSSQALQGRRSVVLPTPIPHAESGADLADRIDRVTDLLAQLQLPVPLPTPTLEPQGAASMRWTSRWYAVTLPQPADLDQFTALFDSLRGTVAGLVVQTTVQANGIEVQVGIDGLRTHTIAFHWLGRRPRMAFIISDLGDDLLAAREFATINAPLTFAILPFQAFSKAVAERAALAGREILIQLPPLPEPKPSPTADGLPHPTPARDEFQRWMDESLAAIPQAVGSLDSATSHLTERTRIQSVLEHLKENQLFVVDGRADSDNLTCELAGRIALRCARVGTVLDGGDDERRIETQIETLSAAVRQRGDAIVLGSGTPATLAALQAAAPRVAQSGIEITPVSTLLAGAALSRR